ncbi:MAG: hypothetical protein AAGG51_16675 [Cyanobacteria bacterium P01_G01_bin.54]
MLPTPHLPKQHPNRAAIARGTAPSAIVTTLLLGSLTLLSCSVPPTPDAAEPAPEPAAESAPTPVAEAPAPPTPAPKSPAPVQALPTNAPQATPTDGSVFVSDNFTVTITGFGIDAAYKGCDTAGQCLNIPQASSYEAGTYTWENAGYLYRMQGVAGGDYRLEVRDPQGKVLVDERVVAVHNSQSQASVAEESGGDTVEMVDVTLWNLTQGDRGCYVELADGSGNRFTELGGFDLCAQTDLISQIVRVTLQETEVMAESCQGDPSCTETERVPLVIEMRAQAE